MHDPATGALWPIVLRKIDEVLDAHPNLAGMQFIDADGRFIFGGATDWLPMNQQTRGNAIARLKTSDQETISNPVPGIYSAMRSLSPSVGADQHLAIYVLGDEFTEDAGRALATVRQLNPATPTGPRVTINAIAIPTTIRYQFSMRNTGLKFSALMRELTHENGGVFVALPDL